MNKTDLPSGIISNAFISVVVFPLPATADINPFLLSSRMNLKISFWYLLGVNLDTFLVVNVSVDIL